MPNIFDQLSSVLSGNDLVQRLLNQVDMLDAVKGSLTDITQNPPGEIGQLIQNLKGVSLPDTDLAGQLQNAISSLQNMVPSNLDGVTGDLTSGITNLSQSIKDEIFSKLDPYVQSFSGLKMLLQLLEGNGNGNPSAPSGHPAPLSSSPVGSNPPVDNPPVNLLFTSQLADQINEIITALNFLPDPFSVENVLQSLRDVLQRFPRDVLPASYMPVIDEAQQVLETLLDWRGFSGAQIASHIENTLIETAALLDGTADPVIVPITDSLTTLGSQLDTVAFKNILDNLNLELQNLSLVVNTANLGDISNALLALNNLTSELAPILQGLQQDYFNGQDAALLDRLTTSGFNLDQEILSIFSVLNPISDSRVLESFSGRINNNFLSGQAASFSEAMHTFFGWFEELLNQLDFSAVEGPVTTAANAAKDAVDTLDDLLIDIVTQVSLIFDDVEQVVNQIDTTVILTAVEDALQDFQQLLQDQIDALLTPIQDAIAAAVGAIDSAIGAFNPEDIIEALRSAIQAISGVLSSPQILGLLDNIKQTLTNITDQLNAVSFKPVNDIVVGQIDGVTATLNAIDTSALNTSLKLSLSAAVEVLPGEEVINSLKNALFQEMNDLIDAGPIPILENVKKQPDRLLQEVRNYSPLNLLGDQLSAPFNQVVDALESFKPSDLLKPVEQVLAEIKTDLQNTANPGQFIAPLEQPFAELMQAFDNLDPAKLIAPLQQQIDSVIDAVLDAIPVDEFLNIVDDILQKIQYVADSLEAIKNLFQKISSILNGLSDPATQVDAWINSILAQLDQVPGTVNLQAAFDQITAAVNNIKAAPLMNRIVNPLQSFIQSLDDVHPQESLTAIIQSYRDISLDAVNALPQPEKQQVLDFLDAFDPLDPAVSGPISDLQNFLENLQPLPQQIADFFGDWDARFHGTNSPLTQCFPSDTSITSVKALVRQTIEQQVKEPLIEIFQIAPNLAQFANGFLNEITQFTTALQAKLTALLNGPSSLGTIRDAMNELVTKIQNFNLNFLVVELEDLFNTVKGKLDPLNPVTFRVLVEDAFNQILNNLDLSVLLPPDVVANLDAGMAALVDKIKQLDPKALVIDVIQPEFENLLQPYLDAFDLTAFVEALIERLERLKEELSVELDRTAQAFKAMLDAVPSLVSADIGVDVGGLF